MHIEDIFKGLTLTESEKRLIQDRIHSVEAKKGELLLEPGQTVDYQYYVANGCLRSFFVDHSAKEHTIQFAIKDWWISDYTAFYKESAAILSIECIQNATLYRFSRTDMEEIFNQIPSVERFFRLKTESFISSFQKRIIGDLAKSATERYTDFVHDYPNIESLVKNYHIASYLGVTSESLSRIRKEIAMH